MSITNSLSKFKSAESIFRNELLSYIKNILGDNNIFKITTDKHLNKELHDILFSIENLIVEKEGIIQSEDIVRRLPDWENDNIHDVITNNEGEYCVSKIFNIWDNCKSDVEYPFILLADKTLSFYVNESEFHYRVWDLTEYTTNDLINIIEYFNLEKYRIINQIAEF